MTAIGKLRLHLLSCNHEVQRGMLKEQLELLGRKVLESRRFFTEDSLKNFQRTTKQCEENLQRAVESQHRSFWTHIDQYGVGPNSQAEKLFSTALEETQQSTGTDSLIKRVWTDVGT